MRTAPPRFPNHHQPKSLDPARRQAAEHGMPQRDERLVNPVLMDDNMAQAEAIPTWTQHVSPGGDWDDVRIPPRVHLSSI